MTGLANWADLAHVFTFTGGLNYDFPIHVPKEGADPGSVMDYLGTVLQSVESPADGRILFPVSSLAINKGDPLLAVGA